MFSFLITLSIFTYLFRLFWVFVLRVSFSPGVRHSLLISVASPVAEQGSGCMAFGSCGAQALGAQPLASAEHRLWVHSLRQLRSTGSGCTAFGSCRARAPGTRPSAAAEHRLRAHGLRQLQHVGLVVVAPGLRSAGSVVVAHGLSCSQFKPMPPTLADGFFTTEPSGKP